MLHHLTCNACSQALLLGRLLVPLADHHLPAIIINNVQLIHRQAPTRPSSSWTSSASATVLGDIARNPSAEACTAAKTQAQKPLRANREYVVEAITGERGVIAHKPKEYKVKWQAGPDYSDETWIDYTATDKKCQPWLDYKKHKKD